MYRNFLAAIGSDQYFPTLKIHDWDAYWAIAKRLGRTIHSTVSRFGSISSMRAELQHMRSQGGGAIVNCPSLGGLVGGAERGIYHAAKHGVIGFTKSAALEYAARGT